MKVRMTIEVDDVTRYVIAKYFGDGKTRATRPQVRAFIYGAMNRMTRMHGEAMTGRQRAAIRRLRNPEEIKREVCVPREHQLDMLDGAK